MKLTNRQEEYAAGIAVIGKSGRFPEAGNLKQFWQNLCAGKESISFFTEEELVSAGVDPELLRRPNYVKAGGVLQDADLFDAQFFGFNPREAQLIDPQHRVFLECSWEALEDAGYASDDPGMVGVFASTSMSTYMRNLLSNPEILNSSDILQLMLGNDKDHVATRVSYKLNLKGPSVCIQSACSSSLVAVHFACRSLLTYDCDLALAGGVSIGVPFKEGYLYQEGGNASSDGHLRAFDAKANGIVAGHGCGVVVLKRLFEAIKDGDTIQAIIRGSAVNNDGSNKVGYTAPSVDSQADVIRSALAFARVPSETVTYVEAHGTGTPLGDPIELTAFSKAFRSSSTRKARCAIGSLKTNIGHLDAAAGIAGLIKTVLALEHKSLPPSLNFETPNPKASFETSPFYVNTQLREWDSEGTPRRAGVSSLGMGGTNVHLVLEEAPDLDTEKSDRQHHLLVFSAKTQAALDCSTARIADHLQTCSNLRLSDIAHSLQVGRKAFPYRRAVVCESVTEAIQQLTQANGEGLVTGRAEMRNRPVVFMFPGQGAQYPGMGAGLYRTDRVFREHADQCAELLRACLGTDLRPILYPDRPFTESDVLQFAQTHITQPALFVTEYALAKVWMHWGITPEAMIGHSIGEYVAACLSGVMSLEDALVIVAKRGELMQQTQPGTMLAISCSAKQLEAFFDGTISVAAINTPSSCVVSGDAAKIAALEAALAKENISCQRLATSHAFHSGMMDPIVGQFQREIAKIKLGTPKIPYISNLTGGWVTNGVAMDASWARHLRGTVRFADGLSALTASAERVYLEVGPGGSLSSFVKQCFNDKATATAVSSLTRHKPYDHEDRVLLETLGRLWTLGVQVDWRSQYSAGQARRISLPTYPFERQRYFVEPTPSNSVSQLTENTASPSHSRPQLNSVFVEPRDEIEHRIAEVWQSVLGVSPIGIRDDFFDLGGDSLIGLRVTARLKDLGIHVSIEQLFKHRTVQELAALVEQGKLATADSTTSSTSSGTSALQTAAIPRVNRKGKLALSYGQERLWFIYQLEPENVAYNVPGAVRIQGLLDVESLERTLREIVRRHESLRTRFVSVVGEPQQIIDASVAMEVPVTALSHLEEPEREAEARRLALEDARQPFDLARGPLFRVKLLRLASQDHVLVFNMHHIVSDAWSISVLVREVSAIYNNFSTGQPSSLPELDIQYADFSAWQREFLSGSLLEKQLEYWQQKLAAVEPLMLPTDRPRTALQRPEGATTHFTVPVELTEALKTLSRKQGATLYMILLAAFQALLSRYSGQSDITVGSPIAGRSRTETEGLIGVFINTLVLRSDLSGQPDSIELLQRVKATTLEAFANQDVPFEKLVEVLLPQRDLTRMPLFQVLFVLQNVPWTVLQLGAAKMLAFDVDSGAAQFEMSMRLAETNSGMEGFVEYNKGLFDAESVTRMIGHYQMLLNGIVAEPSQSIALLPLMSVQERKQVIEDWNQTEAQYPLDKCVHELFEEQVRRSPQATAVVWEEEELSYGELNARANQLAHYLGELGVQPDERVAICVEHGFEMIVGLLAVLKAGGAYVPLDPAYPEERLRYMLADSAPVVLLTQRHLEDRFSGIGDGVPVLDLNATTAWQSFSERNPDADAIGLTSSHLAYVIYTSGSTGQPKGVMVEHRELGNLIHWHWDAFALKSGQRTSSVAGFGFDVATWEIWPALCVGAVLLLPGSAQANDVERLLDWWGNQNLDVSFLPTPVAEFAFVRGISNASLQTLLIGGDRLARPPVNPPPFSLVNNYGPTETTVVATSGRVESTDGTISIGRPIANTRVYILDSTREPVPVGVVGEMYIGGAGVARGYLKRPELTAERFVQDPFVEEAGARMYRTGDLGRWSEDGTIEFVGRNDNQVKIRGFRIELGEIEARLAEHPEVREAVVLAREDTAGEKRLVAYYTASGIGEAEAASMGAERLRLHLSAIVPDYMVPAAYVRMERLPLTPNGKLDRKSLPAPEADAYAARVYEEPRSETEKVLAGIWAELLMVERVGIHDNFFMIGGHSLMAARVATRINESFTVDIPLRRMFELPTIAQLAEAIDQAVQRDGDNREQSHPLPAIRRWARKAALLPAESDWNEEPARTPVNNG